MPNCRISDDLKEAALRMKGNGYNLVEIRNITQFSASTFYQSQRCKQLTGSVAKKQAVGRGRLRLLATQDSHYLLALACHKPTMFLDEYAKHLKEDRLVDTSLSTIHCTFI